MPANLQSGGLGLLHYPVLNQVPGAVSQMLVNPNVLIGVADAGDHVGLIMDVSQCTYVLGTGCEIPDCSTSAGRCTSSLEGAELSVWPIAA